MFALCRRIAEIAANVPNCPMRFGFFGQPKQYGAKWLVHPQSVLKNDAQPVCFGGSDSTGPCGIPQVAIRKSFPEQHLRIVHLWFSEPLLE